MSSTSVAASVLHFATGPFRATAAETRTEWLPLASYLGQCLGMEATLTVCDDWHTLGDAMASDAYDVAWMGGGFRYVQARARGAGPAIATVATAGSPSCHAVVIAGRNVAVRDFPADARGMSLAFTHVESTTGWLTVYAALVAQQIEPHTYFRYSAGHQHADNVRAVARGDFDLATDNEANRRSMVDRGEVDDADVRIVWRSPPLPQDPIAVSNRLEPQLAMRLQQVLVAIDGNAAHNAPMPRGYSGFVAASDESYGAIREAAVLVGRLPAAAATRMQQVTT